MTATFPGLSSIDHRPLSFVLALACAGCPAPDPTDTDPTTGDSSTSSATTEGAPTSGEPTGTSTADDPTGTVDPSSGDSSSTGSSSTGTSDGVGDSTTGTTHADTTTGGPDETTSTTSDGDPETTGTTSDGDSRGETDGTTGEPVDCEPGDIADGPPAVMVDGALAVPIDVESVTASVVLDWNWKAAKTKATMKFRVGPQGGRPIFDIRQPVYDKIKLDGVALVSAKIAPRDLGGGPDAQMRVLAVDLPACSEHVLELEYGMVNPEGTSESLRFWPSEQAVVWSFGFTDLKPAHYLERWLPTNLIHDRFALTMTVEVLNSPSEQVVLANGAIEELGFHKWKVVYPEHFASLSPMFALYKPYYSHSSAVLEPEGDDPVDLELFLAPSVVQTPAELVAEIAGYFDEFIASTGPYHHEQFYLLLSHNGGGMEYDGAASGGHGVLKHELFHSWFGRGLKPRHGDDGWLDEAWTVYMTDTPEPPFDFVEDPVVLCGRNPWLRVTPGDSYVKGQRVFETIAAVTGHADLRLAMKTLYELHAPGLIDTEQVEQHLYCELQEPVVRDVFNRFVYGSWEPTPPLPPGYCP